MLSTIFWWTGAAVWAGIGLLLVWLVAEVVWGAVVALSWMRWSWKAAVANGMKPYPALLKTPKIFAKRWWEFVGFRAGRTSYQGKDGAWRGVGNWVVYPPEPPA